MSLDRRQLNARRKFPYSDTQIAIGPTWKWS
jgi:hypothetical protein